MNKILLAVLCLSTVVSAQAPPNIVPPTTANTLAWDYSPTAAELPLSGIDHFDVQWSNGTVTAAWASVGKALTASVPALTPGSYTARVRACATAAADRCSQSAPFAFTVSVSPAAVPSGMRLIAK